ncbi:MAG TPA: hypothetical protein VM123_19455 [archaeon]|nr:hypothetical protein [archaeon]
MLIMVRLIDNFKDLTTQAAGVYLFLIAFVFLQLPPVDRLCAGETVLFEEPFEDTDWAARGWYDGPDMKITSGEHIPGSGSSCEWHWRNTGDVVPESRGARVLFTPVESVSLSFYIKHSADWEWTKVNWHPHEFLFMTTEDGQFTGPAYTHLTLYVEVVNGKPRLAIQDGANIDQSRIGENLVGVTERRAVAGGNGDSDGYGGGYYKNGDEFWNGKEWDTGEIYFSDEPGPYYKGDWHHIKASFKLNSVVDGIGVCDGVLQYWYDGRLLMDYRDVLYRTGRHPGMKINQFLMLPYFGPGVPHEQSIWIDDLKIAEEELPASTPGGCDFNNDGALNILDAIDLLLKARADPVDPSLDRDGDGAYSPDDAIALLVDIIHGDCLDAVLEKYKF